MTVRTMLAAAVTVVGMTGLAHAGPDTYIGEITVTGANFCPRGTAEANGQLLPIAQNSALFSLLGTIYGGDGRTTFALPDLRGRAVVNSGRGPGLSDYRQGQAQGRESMTLTVNELPSHTHTAAPHSHEVGVTSAGPDTSSPAGSLLPTYPAARQAYASGATADGAMASGSVTENTATVNATGGNMDFSIMQPVLPLKYCITLQGTFPSRS